MGKYCKAYHVSSFEKFAGWKDESRDVREGASSFDEKDRAGSATALDDEEVLYLQDNYVVTRGIFPDEHIVYDEVTADWKQFCSKELGFEIPEYARPRAEERVGESAAIDGAALRRPE